MNQIFDPESENSDNPVRKILFVSPYHGRAGAEIYLYRFLKNYDSNQFQAILVTEKYSPLFNSLQPKIIYISMERRPYNLSRAVKKTLNRISRKLSGQVKLSKFNFFVEQVHHQVQADIWVLNTIIMQKLMPSASRMKVRVTSIIHELPSAYSFVSQQGLASLLTQSDRIIANSSPTCEAISIMGRPDVTLQPCFFDPEEIVFRQPREDLKAALGIQPDEFVLLGSGSQDYNKGIELFMKISEFAKDKPWKFIWVGGERDTGFNYYLQHYRDKLNLSGNLIFVGEKARDYYDYLNMADAFLLTSLNESFSLSTLEAIALGKPVLVYDCGGIRDFVTDRCGRTIATRSPADWVNSIAWLHNNYLQFSSNELAEIAANYSTTSQVPKLTALLTDN